MMILNLEDHRQTWELFNERRPPGEGEGVDISSARSKRDESMRKEAAWPIMPTNHDHEASWIAMMQISCKACGSLWDHGHPTWNEMIKAFSMQIDHPVNNCHLSDAHTIVIAEDAKSMGRAVVSGIERVDRMIRMSMLCSNSSCNLHSDTSNNNCLKFTHGVNLVHACPSFIDTPVDPPSWDPTTPET